MRFALHKDKRKLQHGIYNNNKKKEEEYEDHCRKKRKRHIFIKCKGIGIFLKIIEFRIQGKKFQEKVKTF